MPPAALGLVVLAACCHASWNLLLKAERGGGAFTLWALAVGLLAFSPVLLVYPLADVPPGGWLCVLLSGVFEAGYFLSLAAAYDAGDLSLVYPVARGTAPILVAPLAVLLLDERLSAAGLAGIALVVGGIVSSHLPAFQAGALRRSPAARRASAFAVLTGVTIAGYSLVDKVGVGLVPVPLYLFLIHASGALTTAVALRASGRSVHLDAGTRWPSVVVVGVLMLTTYLLVLLAMRLAPVSYVVAAREVSIVAATLLGTLALGERHAAPRIAGAAMIFAGLGMLALSR